MSLESESVTLGNGIADQESVSASVSVSHRYRYRYRSSISHLPCIGIGVCIAHRLDNALSEVTAVTGRWFGIGNTDITRKGHSDMGIGIGITSIAQIGIGIGVGIGLGQVFR